MRPGVAERTASTVVTFSGQDPSWATGLLAMLRAVPTVRPWATEVIEALDARLAADPAAAPALANGGLRAEEWLGDPEGSFDPTVRAAGAHSLVGTAMGHLVSARAIGTSGIWELPADAVLTGHSVGLLAAGAVARHGFVVPATVAADVLFALAVMAETAAHLPVVLGVESVGRVLRGDDDVAPAMVSVAGPSEALLVELLADLRCAAVPGDEPVAVALQNAFDRFVLAGVPRDVHAVASRLAERDGVVVEPVASSAPYHHPVLAPSVQPTVQVLARNGVDLGGALRWRLVDPCEPGGSPAGSQEVTAGLAASMLSRPVRWADTLSEHVGATTTVVDLGPSELTAAISRRALEGSGATVLAVGAPGGLRALTQLGDATGGDLEGTSAAAADRSTAVRRLQDWSRHIPAVSADGVHKVATRHTRRSHRSAFVLAGMTPTTVEVPIVAAAAGAGHVAELAGGGQVTAEILGERLAELADTLPPGQEVVFNALHLDPYLWNLHLGAERLVQDARAEGAPLCGVTVSAGVPDREEAVDLLEELNGLGLWLNAFKPGTVAAVRAVLAIADATPHDVWLHMEGGRAGGHHSWVDLEELLFATYGDIRRRDNVVLCAGGGVGTPERAAELLSGRWALRHGPRPMPVDAVLIGTVAMATRESSASPSVKAALVAAPGTEEVVRPGQWSGGVTSARSSLGADIHYLDTHAARVAELLEEIAGDEAEVARRHDEIADALAGTAKPWFGDLTAMTHIEVLERFAELCARGRHGRYEDGRWLDVSLRRRFLELLRRAEARFHELDEGTFASLFGGLHDLDDPDKALAELRRRHPAVETEELHPLDAAHFMSVCDAPGKPVPFVAVIDAQVRRRYLADSLWQAHTDLFGADEVLVIPGPAAVAGITEADEPVAELLDRFDRDVAELLAEDGGPQRSAVPSRTSVEVLVGLPSWRVGARQVPSPLRRLGGPGRWRTETSRGAARAELVHVAAHGAERATLEGPDGATGDVLVRLSWPEAPGVPGDGSLELTVRVGEAAGVPFAELDDASLAAAEQRLLAMLVDAAGRTAALVATPEGAPAPLVDTASVPDAVVRSTWGPLFDALADDLGGGLLGLVHARHTVLCSERRAQREAGTTERLGEGAPSAEVVGGDHVAAGRRILTVARAGEVEVRDTFVVRTGAAGDGSTADPTAEATAGAAGGTDAEEIAVGEPTVEGPGRGPGREVPWQDTPRHHLARVSRSAARRPERFATASGDLNPIHRSDLLARFAGLPGRIVHGVWTSAAGQAAVVAESLDGDATRLRSWDVAFLDTVMPGDELEIDVARTGVRDGSRRLEISVRGPRGPVATAQAEATPPTTAYVFPGQGIQAQGMGMDGYDRCPAARHVWDRADEHTRAELGFSVLDVVRRNPRRLVVDGPQGREEHRHPAGVLHLTQFTQVAMATLASAQVAELREAGVMDTGAVFAGHSVGEYNALAAVGGVLPLEAVLGIVWARGTAMHHLVPRDASGASEFRLGVVRPHLADLDADAATQLVDAVAEATGELCEVVNHNLRGRQYAVAGTRHALEELERRLGEGSSPGRAPFLLVPGIDVPFHSRALADGVPSFREHLRAALPEEIDPTLLVGRYVPNLHPEPFSLDRSYVEAVAALCRRSDDDPGTCAELLADWDARSARPSRLARDLLVELLSWQFASPVRWIETTDVLVDPLDGLGVQRVVEVGLGAAPTLANLTSAAMAAAGRSDVAVRHVEMDRPEVFEEIAEPSPPEATLRTGEELDRPAPIDPDDLADDWDGESGARIASAPAASSSAPSPEAEVEESLPATAAEAPTAPVPVTTAAGAGGSVEDRPVDVGDALAALLAHTVGVRSEQLGDDSVEQLVDGASSRRNQVLMDLGKEFGIGAVDGAHEVARSELADKLAGLARAYRFPGPVLGPAMAAASAAALGPLGASASFVDEHVRNSWDLGDGWAQRARLELLLGTREGPSRRGGSLATLERGADAASLVDDALQAAAGRVGAVLSRPVATAAASSLDGADVEELLARVDAAVSAAAEAAAGALCVQAATPAQESGGDADDVAADRERLVLLDREHGADRAEAVRPIFDPEAVHWFDSGLTWARADVEHLVHGTRRGELAPQQRTALAERLATFTGTDPRFDDTVAWHRGRAAHRNDEELRELLDVVAAGATDDQRRWAERVGGRVVLVSGASPGSIAEAVVIRLLAGGATVVVLTSSTEPARRRAARELERRHGGPGARLVLARANLASFGDVDAVCRWLAEPALVPDADAGAEPPVIDLRPGLPDVVLPFAAPPVLGEAPDTGAAAELELRVLLLGVERLVGRLSEAVGELPAAGHRRLTAVLPLSPNHGTFGGDGAYGTAKAGLEVLVNRRRAEHRRWGRHCELVAAEIGWVRGTGLMAANDALAEIVEQRLGVRTFSAAEMGAHIAELCATSDQDRAAEAPPLQRVDLTGGLGSIEDRGALADLLRNGLGSGDRSVSSDEGDEADRAQRAVSALPSPLHTTPLTSTGSRSDTGDWSPTPRLAAENMVVICGVAEVGPWGTSVTRADAELGRLSGAAVIELALHCGLLEWTGDGAAGDLVEVATGEVVGEAEAVARVGDEVLARCGIRPSAEFHLESEAAVFSDRPLTVAVASRAEADAVAAAVPGATISDAGGADGTAAISVTLPAGSTLRIPKRHDLPRRVTAALPDGMSPESLGLPVELASAIDPLAAWNVAVSAEAFRDAGTEPAELAGVVHPARMANTQGCGMGGMESLRAMYLDPVRGTPHANDLLQEALPNTPAAHAMQSLLGGYGPTIHPVAACATAGVSLEVAADLIRLDKADVVLAGGFDDLSAEGIIGFADMAATADDAALATRGIAPAEMSRPGDRSRSGFVESQGGGAMVVCRGSVAIELGLPVRAVVVHAGSQADGLQRSIPAPGQGALAATLGGADSPLGRALADHGLTADDIAVVSKHDTSTRANDPNEARLHERMAELLGRTPGNALRVVSQKALTGHAKGGAAAWQIAGLCDLFDRAVVPGNPNLDSVDPSVVAGGWLVPDDRPLALAEAPHAALVTSLGFGHVSAVVLLAHPEVFVAAAGGSAWAERALRRRRDAARARRWQPFGGEPAFRRQSTRLAGADDAERAAAERELLADPGARH